jgi:hypothetical protein
MPSASAEVLERESPQNHVIETRSLGRMRIGAACGQTHGKVE